MMIGSPSSASNMYGVVNDNSNPYRNMIMDAMRMNPGNVSQCPIIEKNLMKTRLGFLICLKILMNQYGMTA